MKKLKMRMIDFFLNRKHERLAPECDIKFKNGVHVWKRKIPKGTDAQICSDCYSVFADHLRSQFEAIDGTL